MSGSLSPRVAGLLALAGAAVIAGLATGRPELAVLATPLLVFVGVGLVMANEPDLAVELSLERDRMLEGGETRVTVTLRNKGTSGVEVRAWGGPDAEARARTGRATCCCGSRRVARSREFRAIPLRWGAHAVGPLVVRARDPLGMTSWSGRLAGQGCRCACSPASSGCASSSHRCAPNRSWARMSREREATGSSSPTSARLRSATVPRQVNWRATARRGALYVTERHPEHSSDVVLLLDTFAEARDGASGTLDAAVRAATSLARAHLARRDRVALVDFGGDLQWLEPAFGTTQLYRIIDALLASEIAFSYAWREVESIPRRVLPPGALILAITPLLDERSIGLVTDLRTRGR